MPFDFNTPVDRRNTQSVKWNVGEHELPMWIADMDFASPPEVVEAVRRRAEHGVFGYNFMPDTWREAIAGWWARRHGFSFDPNDLLFATGVVPAVASIIRRLTNVGENIVLQTPAYNAFFPTITNNGRHVLENPMLYENGQYRLDFDDLEYKLSSPQTTMLILCNPHNPAGKIWPRGELARIGELCEKHHILVLADEIHCDLTDPGCEYTPLCFCK
jgi:cystathionine beta-lyase